MKRSLVTAFFVTIACRSPREGQPEAAPVDAARLPAAEAVVDVYWPRSELVVSASDETGNRVLSKPVMHLETLEHPFAAGPRCVSVRDASALTIACIHDDGRISDVQFAVRDGALYIEGVRVDTDPPAEVRSVRTPIESGERSELERRRLVDGPEARCAGITPKRAMSVALVTKHVANDGAAPPGHWSIELSIPDIHALVPFLTLGPMHACSVRVDDRSIFFGCESGEAPVENEARLVGQTLYLRGGTAVQLPCDAVPRFQPTNPCKQFPAMGECH